jgi:Cation transporter/ATPase, N-terminus
VSSRARASCVALSPVRSIGVEGHGSTGPRCRFARQGRPYRRPVPPVQATTADRLDLARAAAMDTTEVATALGSGAGGLSGSEAARRLAEFGPNAVRTHRARAWTVLGRQLRSPLLLLLLTHNFQLTSSSRRTTSSPELA